MDLPIEIKNKIESLAESYPMSDLKKAAKNISDKYLANERTGERLVISKLDVLVYALTRMPATFASVSTALEWSLDLVDNDIQSILDIGAGTGSSILACSYLLPDVEYTCLEREEEMINFARDNISRQPTFIKSDASNGLGGHKADLIIASYFMNELNDSKKDNVLMDMWNNANKYILIVEPGTPEAFKEMKYIRDFFLSKGAYIAAPCPHTKTCPLSKSDWCHFSTRVSRSKLHKLLKNADVPYEDEKFTYLFISKTPTKPVLNRVLRHPLIKTNLISLQLCHNDGQLISRDIIKRNKDEYKAAKKAKVGDIYNF